MIGNFACFQTSSEDDELLGDMEFSLSNTGNTELLIRGIDIDLEGAEGDYFVPEINSKDIPSVIKPGGILLLKFGFPILFTQTAARNNHGIKLIFNIISSQGKLYLPEKTLKVMTDPESGFDFSKESWSSLQLGKETT